MKERHREADRMCDELHFARGDSMIAVDTAGESQYIK